MKLRNTLYKINNICHREQNTFNIVCVNVRHYPNDKKFTYSIPHVKVKTDQPYRVLNFQPSDDGSKAVTTMLAILVVCHRVTGRLYMDFYYNISIFMNTALFSPPPVGLTSADDVTEGFPLDLSVPCRAL